MAQVKILSGYSDGGGSTIAFINLTNECNIRGIDCTFYGRHGWHLNKCKSGLLSDYSPDPSDSIITHFLRPIDRPRAKRVVLSCHEKWSYMVSDDSCHWDTAIFLHESHARYHAGYTGDYCIIPNIKERIPVRKKPGYHESAGIIGTIEPNKQVHISIMRALSGGYRKVLIFGRIGDMEYFLKEVRPLLSDRVIMMGEISNKEEIYSSIGVVYHSSISEVATLVKDECYTTRTRFEGNEETRNVTSSLSNDKIIELWRDALQLD